MPDNAQVRRHLFLIRINLETIGPIFRWSILQFISLTSKFIRFLRSKEFTVIEIFKLLNEKMMFPLEQTNHFFFRLKTDCIFSFKQKMIAFFSQQKRLDFFTKKVIRFFYKKKTFEISSARKPLNLLSKKRLNFFCQAKRLHFSLTKLTKCFYCKKRFFFLLNTKWLNFSLPNKKPLIFFLPK